MASFDYNTFCCNLCIVDVSLTNYSLQRKNTEYNILPQSILVVVIKLGHHANALLWQEAWPGVCFHQISAVALWETLSFHCTTGEVVFIRMPVQLSLTVKCEHHHECSERCIFCLILWVTTRLLHKIILKIVMLWLAMSWTLPEFEKRELNFRMNPTLW